MVRMTIRIVSKLNERLTEISKKTGKSKNAIIVDLCWQFVEDWQEKQEKENIDQVKNNSEEINQKVDKFNDDDLVIKGEHLMLDLNTGQISSL